MDFLIVGGGSMGKRRIRCLIANGVAPEQIRLFDPRADRRDESKSKYNVDGLADFDAAMRWNPAALCVCIPGERAAEVCAIALEAGKHVFCEVPMGTTAEQTQRLGELAEQHGVLACQGAQQPFHPLVIQCRDWLQDSASFGKPLLFNLEWGQYVPGWHPYEDLSAFYSPAQLLGVMNLEFAQLYFITGDRVTELKALRRQVSTLRTPGGDSFKLVGQTQRGMSLAMQFDLIQRPARNVVRFASERGTIEIDFSTDSVRRYLVATRQWETMGVPQGYAYEQCYIEEIGLLLRCIQGEAKWHNPVSQAVDIARVLDALQKSGEEPGTKVSAH